MTRRVYLDWLRGLAVLIMIEAHTLDSWTRVADRSSTYGWLMVLAGYGAPYFMFLAGVAMALAAGSRERKGMSAHDASRLARNRGWQVLGLAFLFRSQSWLVSGASLESLLKVDILNIMGLSMVAAALLLDLGRSRAGRAVALAGAAILFTAVTPIVRQAGWVDALPEALAAYLRPVPGRTTFTFFPWTGFLLAGTAVGLWLDTSRTPHEERRIVTWLGVAGMALALGGYGASYLPSLYERSEFWTSSPTYFFVRLGILLMTLPLAYLWTGVWKGWSPLVDFGRSSLFVYWVHVELVYGLLSRPISRTLSLPSALAGFALFTVFMYLVTLAKVRVLARWREGSAATPVLGRPPAESS
jgi:uncharacterized membrane protein